MQGALKCIAQCAKMQLTARNIQLTRMKTHLTENALTFLSGLYYNAIQNNMHAPSCSKYINHQILWMIL